MSEAGVEIWVGGANTWECDRMGHLNVRFYVAKAMEALGGLAAELGMPRAFSPNAAATLRVREHHIRFLKEVHPGVALTATGGVISMSETGARLLVVLRHLTGEPAAAFQVLVDHVTAEGQDFAWPARVRARAQALAVEIPDYAAARSVDAGPVIPGGSLARAEALGLKRLALGVVGPHDCDAFGRMRPEMFMARISDGIPRLFSGPAIPVEGVPPERVGGAAMEYRLIYFSLPKVGERVELRSGFSNSDARFRTIVHWLLDPNSDRVWGAAAAIAGSFDLQTRKLITHSEAAQKVMQAQVTPGLGF